MKYEIFKNFNFFAPANIFFILMTFDVSNFDKSKEVNSKILLNIPDISFTFEVFILPKVIVFKLEHPSNIEAIFLT